MFEKYADNNNDFFALYPFILLLHCSSAIPHGTLAVNYIYIYILFVL